MRTLTCISALLMVLAVACGDDGSGGPANTGDIHGPPDSVGDADGNVDGAGPGADDTDGTATPGCTSDEDCDEEGAICACDGECVVPTGEPCEQNMNCGGSAWCNPCMGHCEPLLGLCEPCSTVNVCDETGSCKPAKGGPCGDNGVCIPFAEGGSFCGVGCINDSGCPNGYECVEVGGALNKQCVPTSGSCEDLGLCESDDECPFGLICNDFSSRCAEGCEDDEECPGDDVCSQGRCQPSCMELDNCEEPFVCNEDNGRCEDPNACKPGECQPQSYCDEESGDCIPGCLEDTHCQDAQFECVDNACVEKGCIHNYQCSFEELCDQETGECVPMERDHCAECTAGQQDSNAQCGGDPNLCVTFQDEDGNEKGDFCLLTCDPDDAPDQCPQGYQCDKIESDDGSVNDWYCTRMCWEDPYGNNDEEETPTGEEETPAE
ncbi:MAG: hypothetical protein ACQEXJ_01110 [Myxococcota bacterium]